MEGLETLLDVRRLERGHIDDGGDLITRVGLEQHAVHRQTADGSKRENTLGEVDCVGDALKFTRRKGGYDNDELRIGIVGPVE